MCQFRTREIRVDLLKEIKRVAHKLIGVIDFCKTRIPIVKILFNWYTFLVLSFMACIKLCNSRTINVIVNNTWP